MSTPFSWAHILTGKTKPKNNYYKDSLGTIHIIPRTIFPQGVFGHTTHIRNILAENDFLEADLVFIDQQTFAPILDLVTAKHKIYRPTDISVKKYKQHFERELLPKVDAVAATGAPVLEAISHLIPSGMRTAVFVNGVDPAFFAPQLTDTVSRSATLGGGNAAGSAVYVGAVDQRFDQDFVIRFAETYPDFSVEIYGPVTIKLKDQLPENLHFCGPVKYQEVSGLLQSSTIGLLPFNDHDLNGGRSPMKFYEYLASGLYVVAKRTPELERRQSAGMLLYDSAHFGSTDLEKLPRGRNTAGMELAKQFTWDKIAQQLLDWSQSKS
jgi:glycosyltransferase involved in cell wall biosynthesis